MYAVIATGGKQYRVEKDGVLKIELLSAEPGSTVEFTEVLLIADGDKITRAARTADAQVLGIELARHVHRPAGHRDAARFARPRWRGQGLDAWSLRGRRSVPAARKSWDQDLRVEPSDRRTRASAILQHAVRARYRATSSQRGSATLRA